MSASSRAHYRADIDGLRAIAILGVLIFHLRESWLPGGFLGVDVFFVISGYLITSIIRREIAEGRFSFGRFYERRIRRIMPAFFAVMSITSVLACATLMPTELAAFAKSLRYALLAAGNFHFLDVTQNYFADQLSPPLLHTWSLGVEEQFYFVLPPILLIFYKWKKSRPAGFALIGGLLVLSFAACVTRGLVAPAETFFLLPHRAWQMLLGALITYSAMPGSFTSRHGSVTGSLGLVLILASMIWVDGASYMPGWSALPASLGAALVILGGASGNAPACRLLSIKPMVFVGLISYSVYLWHWPLIALAKPALGESAVGPLMVGALSLVLGWASWRWIETPFRRSTFLTKKQVYAFWATMTAALLGVATILVKTKGLEALQPPEIRAMLAWKTNRPSFPNNVKKHWDVKRAPVYGAPNVTPSIALWGDSHADALMPWLDAAARKANRSVRLFTIAGQAPIPGVVVRNNNNAERLRYTADVLEEILATPELKTVILHARWAYSLHGYNEESGLQRIRFYQYEALDENARASHLALRLRETITRLLDADREVVLVYPVPEAKVNIPDLLARNLAQGAPLPEFLPVADFDQRQRDILAALDAIPENPRLRRIRLHERLLVDGKLRIQSDQNPLYFDDDHLSTAGLDHVKDLLDPIITDSRFRVSPLD